MFYFYFYFLFIYIYIFYYLSTGDKIIKGYLIR